MITWDELPIEIQYKILDYQEKQGNPRNPNIFRDDIEAGSIDGGFTWRDTEEGHNFCLEVLMEENFKKFYERYPKKDLSMLINDVINKLK